MLGGHGSAGGTPLCWLPPALLASVTAPYAEVPRVTFPYSLFKARGKRQPGGRRSHARCRGRGLSRSSSASRHVGGRERDAWPGCSGGLGSTGVAPEPPRVTTLPSQRVSGWAPPGRPPIARLRRAPGHHVRPAVGRWGCPVLTAAAPPVTGGPRGAAEPTSTNRLSSHQTPRCPCRATAEPPPNGRVLERTREPCANWGL